MIAVLDYGIGNLRSAEKALQHVGADARLVDDPAAARGAQGVVLPGVGAFGRCMEALRQSGLDRVARQAVDTGTPFLGICVGMQMLYDRSEEDPEVKGLGIMTGAVRRLPPGQKVPQMQWNQLRIRRPSRLLSGCTDQSWFYFVHSYAPEDAEAVVADCEYGGPVVAAVETERVWATQFHPEKSGPAGLAVLANFAAACGSSCC
jgi:glutamine amidotransferase